MDDLPKLREEIQSKELEIQTLEARLRATRGYLANLRERVAVMEALHAHLTDEETVRRKA